MTSREHQNHQRQFASGFVLSRSEECHDCKRQCVLTVQKTERGIMCGCCDSLSDARCKREQDAEHCQVGGNEVQRDPRSSRHRFSLASGVDQRYRTKVHRRRLHQFQLHVGVLAECGRPLPRTTGQRTSRYSSIASASMSAWASEMFGLEAATHRRQCGPCWPDSRHGLSIRSCNMARSAGLLVSAKARRWAARASSGSPNWRSRSARVA
jgi:hypothetical protein